MMLDELNKEQLEKLIRFIGNGRKPIKQAKFLIENGGLYFIYKPTKGYVKVICEVRNYAYNKLAALLPNILPATRKIYVDITSQIWIDLPDWAKAADYSCIIDKEKGSA